MTEVTHPVPPYNPAPLAQLLASSWAQAQRKKVATKPARKGGGTSTPVGWPWEAQVPLGESSNRCAYPSQSTHTSTHTHTHTHDLARKSKEGRVQPATLLPGNFFERLRRGSWESNTGAWLRTAHAPKCSRRPSFCLCEGAAKPTGGGQSYQSRSDRKRINKPANPTA